MSLSEKLPTIGSTLRNRHGIEWTVADHIRASSIATKPGDESELTYYPVIFPENLSERFNEFLAEVARCTPKIILPLDTMPRVFPNRAHAGGHSIDAWSHPEGIHVFLDAEDVSEVVLAHELAHAWIDFVKGIEDHRVWSDREDTGRYTQVQLMQSFVLDFAVHKALEEKGFDQTQIRADWEIASMQLRVAAEHGYRPENPREAIYMASHLAAVLVEESLSTLPVPLANSLPLVKRNLPEIFGKATGLAEAVSDNFPADRESALKAIDSVLGQSFAFTDPDLDYASQLLYVEPELSWETDKTPDWLKGQPVRAKCEIGVVMARLGATSADVPVHKRTNDLLEVAFQRPDGSMTKFTRLEHGVVPRQPGEEVKSANERIEEVHRAKKRMEEVKKLSEQKQTTNGTSMPQVPQVHLSGNPLTPPGQHIPGFRTRTYSPGMARWLTKVRMDEMLDGEHAYSYALNNPATYTDPTGHRITIARECECYTCDNPHSPLPNHHPMQDMIDEACRKLRKCWFDPKCRQDIIDCVNKLKPGIGEKVFKCVVAKCNAGTNPATVYCGGTWCGVTDIWSDEYCGWTPKIGGCDIRICADENWKFCGWKCPDSLTHIGPYWVKCERPLCNAVHTLIHELGHCCGTSHGGNPDVADGFEECWVGSAYT